MEHAEPGVAADAGLAASGTEVMAAEPSNAATAIVKTITGLIGEYRRAA
jgi:hypothetical protein